MFVLYFEKLSATTFNLSLQKSFKKISEYLIFKTLTDCFFIDMILDYGF